jgi:hypothetical protein
MNRTVRVLVSAPVVLLAIAFALTLTLSVNGANPIWRTEPLNLAEAAALRDRGEVARLLAAGADARASRPVRGGFLYKDQTTLTPAEAAVLADRPEILQLLLDYGLVLDGVHWSRVWCAAPSDDIREVLEPVRPPDTVAACAPAAIPVAGPSDGG